jgi:hypothetical protein
MRIRYTITKKYVGELIRLSAEAVDTFGKLPFFVTDSGLTRKVNLLVLEGRILQLKIYRSTRYNNYRLRHQIF